MDATLSGETTTQAPNQTTKEYKSPPHALIWFFRKSRDLWKSKYQELQASIKGCDRASAKKFREFR